MPDSIVHGTLATGAAKEIASTVDGRLKIDADYSGTTEDAFGRLRVSHPLTQIGRAHV